MNPDIAEELIEIIYSEGLDIALEDLPPEAKSHKKFMKLVIDYEAARDELLEFLESRRGRGD
jgi:hypothetical protein